MNKKYNFFIHLFKKEFFEVINKFLKATSTITTLQK